MRCKNCDSELREDSKFCESCGGRVIKNRLTIKNLFSHFTENFLNYDNKILQTFIALFRDPADVIVGYIDGVRKKHTDVIGYFALALTLSGFQIFVLEKFFPGLFSLEGLTQPGQEEFQQNYMDILMEYQSIVMMLYVPIYAFLAKLVFYDSKRFNYTELMVVFLYILSQVSIISFFVTIFAGLLDIPFEIFGFYIFIPFQIIYSAYVLKKIYHLNVAEIILKTLIFFIIGGVIFVIIVIALIGIMFWTGDMQEMIETQRKARQAVSPQ